MSDYDGFEEPNRKRTTIAIAVAVVLLALLGGSVGFILATAHRSERTGANPGSGTTSTPTPTKPASSTKATGSPKATNPSKQSYQPTSDSCPQQAADAAGVELSLVLYLKTSRSEVWICKNAGGSLYYQGHVRGGDFPSATSNTSIFLTDVRQDSGTYRATNADTVYEVTAQRLRILKNGAVSSNEPAVS